MWATENRKQRERAISSLVVKVEVTGGWTCSVWSLILSLQNKTLGRRVISLFLLVVLSWFGLIPGLLHFGIYSFFQLLMHNFENRARFSKPLHIISTTPQIICKMYSQNYTMSYKTLFCCHNISTAIIWCDSVKHSCAQPKTLLAFTQRKCKNTFTNTTWYQLCTPNENIYFFSCTQVSQYWTFHQNIP